MTEMKHIFIVIKNSIAVLARELLNKGALAIMIFFIGRFLGKAELGRYALALAISQILFVATDLGLNTLLVREVAKDKSEASKYLFNFGIVNFGLSVITLFFVGLVAWILKCPPQLTSVIFLCAFSYFLIRFIVLFEAVFQALEKMEYQFYAGLFKNAIFIPLGVFYLYSGGGLAGLFYIFLVTNILTLIMIGFLCIKIIKFKLPPFDIDFLISYTVKTFPIWLTQLFALVYLKVATLFLYKLKGDEAVGTYNAAYIVVDGFLVLSGVFARALFPRFAHFYAESVTNLRTAYEKSINFMVFLFLPAAIAIIILADRLMLLAYGRGFEGTALVVRILSCTAFLVIFGALNSYIIITIDKQKIMPYICGFGVVLNLALNIWLIPALSYLGAAISSAITEFIMFSILTMAIKKYFYDIPLSAIFLKTVVGTAVTGFFIYIFRGLNIFVLAAASSGIYLLVIYAIRGFLYQERAYIKNILRIS